MLGVVWLHRAHARSEDMAERIAPEFSYEQRFDLDPFNPTRAPPTGAIELHPLTDTELHGPRLSRVIGYVDWFLCDDRVLIETLRGRDRFVAKLSFHDCLLFIAVTHTLICNPVHVARFQPSRGAQDRAFCQIVTECLSARSTIMSHY